MKLTKLFLIGWSLVLGALASYELYLGSSDVLRNVLSLVVFGLVIGGLYFKEKRLILSAMIIFVAEGVFNALTIPNQATALGHLAGTLLFAVIMYGGYKSVAVKPEVLIEKKAA